jgi:hypothetical protein
LAAGFVFFEKRGGRSVLHNLRSFWRAGTTLPGAMVMMIRRSSRMLRTVMAKASWTMVSSGSKVLEGAHAISCTVPELNLFGFIAQGFVFSGFGESNGNPQVLEHCKKLFHFGLPVNDVLVLY